MAQEQFDRPVVFVHTNDSQLLPALVGVYSLRARATVPDSFDVKLLHIENTELDERRDGQTYRARGIKVWNHLHHSAFHFLRRRVPELMQFQGRALVLDPDVLAIQSIEPLLAADMHGKAILARYRPEGFLGQKKPFYSSSVMLLDCGKLQHWHWDQEVDGLFAHRCDYWDLLELLTEDRENIGELDEIWNSLDKLTPDTRLLHYTRVSTQPWLTGLPMPDDIHDPTVTVPRLNQFWRRLLGRPLRVHIPHPDANQERIFFDLLAECLSSGALPESMVSADIAAGRMRTDAFEMLARSGYAGASSTKSYAQNLLAEFSVECSSVSKLN